MVETFCGALQVRLSHRAKLKSCVPPHPLTAPMNSNPGETNGILCFVLAACCWGGGMGHPQLGSVSAEHGRSIMGMRVPPPASRLRSFANRFYGVLTFRSVTSA